MKNRTHRLGFGHLSALDRVTFLLLYLQYKSYIMAEIGGEGMFQYVTVNIET